MRPSQKRRVLGAFVAGLLCVAAWTAPDIPLQVAKYHDALRRRPEPGYLFDQFHNAWLDTGTAAELGQYLQRCADESQATNDRMLLAIFHAKQGRNVEALQVYGRIVAAAPDNASAWFYKAEVEARTLDFETALSDLQKAQTAGPDDELAANITKLTGRLYVRDGQRDKALAVWRDLLAEHPDDLYLYEDIIELQIDEGLLDEALTTSQALIAKTTDNYQAVLYRLRVGDIHQRAGQRENALAAYADTLDQVGRDTWLEREILAQIEQVFRHEDDIEGLRQHLAELLTRYGDRVTLRKRYAQVLHEAGQADAAIEQWRGILAAMPGDRALREAYARMLSEAGRHADATEQLVALVQQHPDDAELLTQLARLQYQQEDTPAAVATLDRYIEQAGHTEFAYLRTARTLEQFRQIEAATGMFERLVTEFPNSIDARQSQAEFLYRNDHKDQAKALWMELAEGADVEGLLQIARALGARNEHQPAYDLLAGRVQAHAQNARFVAELCRAALLAKKHTETLPWAVAGVKLASEPQALEAAIARVGELAGDADGFAHLIQQLREKPVRGVATTCLLAELLEQTNDSAGADDVLATLPTDNPLGLSTRVRLYSQRHDWTRAAETLQQLIALPGGKRSVYVRQLVDLYTRSLQIDEAQKWLPQWKRLSPGSASPWLHEAKLHQMVGDDATALEVLRRGAQQLDGKVELLVALASAYSDVGKLKDAKRIYWKLYQRTDDINGKLRWVSSLAQVAMETGQLSQLIESFQERSRNSRTNIEPRLALAEIYRVSQDYEERRKALLEAARIKPDDPRLLLAIARIEENEGEYKRALKTLLKAAEIDDTGRVEQHMVRIHLAAGDEDKAYALLLELAGGDQIDARGAEGIADTMAGTGDWGRVTRFLDDFAVRFPQDYRLAYLSAVALEEELREAEATDAFLRILDMDQEIPGNAAQSTQMPWSAWGSILQSLLPPDSMRLLDQTWTEMIAYTHRAGQQSYLSYPGMGGGARTTVNQPNSIGEAHHYALAHLHGLAELCSEPERARVIAAVKQRGVTIAELLFALPMSYRGFSLQTIPPDMLETHGDEPALAALWVVMNSVQAAPTSLDLERSQRYYDMFAETRPQLAYLAALTALRAHPEQDTLLRKAIDGVRDLQQPNVYSALATAQILGGLPESMSEFGEAAVPDEARQMLTGLLVGWYPKLSASGGQIQQYTFLSVAGALAAGKDAAAFVQFLDEEVTRYRSAGARSTGGLFGFAYSDQEMIRSLPMPPHELPGFPSHVIDVLGPSAATIPFGTVFAIDFNLAEHLDEAQDPVLKTLLACAAEDEETLEKCLAAMLASKQPAAAAYMLAAAHAGQAGDFAKSLSLLNTARFLPLDRQTRQRIDAAIVACALEKLDDEQAVAAGREAALRLRRAPLQGHQRLELIAALEQLKLSEEAQQLERKAVATPTPTGWSSGPGISSGTKHADQIRALLQEGEREKAVKLARRQYEAWARELRDQTNSYWDMYPVEQLTAELDRRDLVDAVLTELRPNDGGSTTRLLQFGRACELLKHHDEARRSYEAVLEKKPGESAALVRLVLLDAATDAGTVIRHLQALHKRDVPQVTKQLVNLTAETSASNPKQGLALCELLVQWMKSKEGVKPDGRELVYLPRCAAWGLYSDDFALPHLYTRNTTIDENQAEHAKTRRRVHDELCHAMLEYTDPAVREIALQSLIVLAELENADLEPLAALAEEVILAKPERKARTYTARVTHYGHGDDSAARLRSMDEFLVRHAWQKKDPARIREHLLPKLRETGQTQKVQSLEALAGLYFEPAERFADVARKYLRQRKRQQAPYDDDCRLDVVVEAWHDRDFSTPLTAVIIDTLKSTAEFQYGETLSCTSDLVAGLHRHGGRAAIAAFLEAAAEELVGPAEERQEVVHKYCNTNRIRSGTVNARVLAYRSLLVSMLGEAPSLWEAMERYQLFIGTDDEVYEWGATECIDQVLQQASTDPQRLIAFLQDSPFVADLGGFRSYPLNSRPQQRTLLDKVLHCNNAKLRKAVVEWCATETPKTFGVELIEALLKRDDERAACEVLGRHVEELRGADPRVVTDLVALFRRRTNTDGLSDQARKAMQLLFANYKSQAEETTEAFLEAKRLSDLPFDEYRLDDETVRMMERVIPYDAELAIRILQKAHSFHQQRVRGGHYGYPGDEASFVGDVLGQLANEHPSPKTLGFVLRLVRDSTDPPIPVTDRVTYGIAKCIRASMNPIRSNHMDRIDERNRSAEPNTRISTEERYREERAWITEWCHLVEPHLPEGDITLLDLSLRDVRECGPGPHPLSVKGWLADTKEQEATSRLRACLAASAKLAGPAYGKLDPEELEKLHDRYRPVLENTDLTLSYRLSIAAYACSEGENTMGRRLDGPAARVLSEALADDATPVSPRAAAGVLHSFRRGEQTDEWKAQATVLLDGYLKRQGRGGSITVYSSQYWAKNARKPLSPAMCMLELALALGRWDDANRLARAGQSGLAAEVGTWALLIRYGRHEEARQLIRKHAEATDGMLTGGIVYDRTLHEQIPAFVAGFERDDLRYAAEVFLSAFPDARQEDPAQADALPSRGKRLRTLAQRFGDVELAKGPLKNRLLLLLTEEDATMDFLLEPLVEATRHFDVVTITTGDSGLHGIDAALIIARCRCGLTRGEPQYLLDTHRQLRKARDSSSRSWQVQNSLEMLNQFIEEEVIVHPESRTIDQLCPLCELLRAFASPCDTSDGYTSRPRVRMLNLIVHAACDQMDELTAWRDTLCGKHRKELDNDPLNDLWRVTTQVLVYPSRAPVEVRVGTLQRLSSDPRVANSTKRKSIGFSSWHAYGLLNDTELIERGPEICEQGPHSGVKWAELAEYVHQQGREDITGPMWERAIELAVDADGWDRVRIADHLAKAKRYADAEEILNGVEPSDDSELEQQRTTLLNRIQRQHSPNKAPNPPDKSAKRRRGWTEKQKREIWRRTEKSDEEEATTQEAHDD